MRTQAETVHLMQIAYHLDNLAVLQNFLETVDCKEIVEQVYKLQKELNQLWEEIMANRNTP